MQKKSSQTLYAVVAVMAALLVLGGVGLMWMGWRAVQLVKQEAAHAGSVMLGDASVLVGKSDYVGTWTGRETTMRIEPTGQVEWSHKDAHSSEKLNGSISFDGSDLVIDVLVMKKHLRIDKAPHVDGSRTVMTLDGEELDRK